MAANVLLTRSYATNIYLTGTTTFEYLETNGKTEYVTPVMQYAADKFYIDDINRAATNGWISAQRAADTIAMKDPTDPQYRDYSLQAAEPAAQ